MAKQNLTKELIATKVEQRTKFFDAKESGLYVSITPKGGVSFGYKYYDSVAKKQKTVTVDASDVDGARKAVRILKGEQEKDIDIHARARKVDEQVKAGEKTFAEVAALYIKDISSLEEKEDGELRPVRESWDRVQQCLDRPIAAFGKKPITQVTDDDCAAVLQALTAERKVGAHINTRSALFGLFKWAGQPGHKYVTANPCSNLGKRPKLRSRKRTLVTPEGDAAEVAQLWHGLDRADCPVSRKVALAYKLILCTALRPGEVCSIQRENIADLDGATPTVKIEAKVVKKRRVIVQPLNSLAVEIVRELLALSDATTGPLFTAGERGAKFVRKVLSDRLHDKGRNNKTIKADSGEKVYLQGLISFLGIKAFRPHDLRRTAATLLGNADVANRKIGEVLDHQDKDANPTTSIYNRAEKNKRPTLELLATLLGGIITPPAEPKADNVVQLVRAA